jgi:hypothetical protein
MSDSPTYCCYFHSVGSFEDMDDVDLFMACDWKQRGDFIKGQGEWKIDQTDWSLYVGISDSDEEWRQKNDVEEFLVENFAFLNRLCLCPKVHFYLSLSYRGNPPLSVDFSSPMIAMMGALRISLGIYFNPALTSGINNTELGVKV